MSSYCCCTKTRLPFSFKDNKEAQNLFQELYNLGARRISVSGISPIGCLPSQRTLAGGIERECADLYNQAAVIYNSELSKELQRLNHSLPGSRILFIDMYTSLLDLMQRPEAYGKYNQCNLHHKRFTKILSEAQNLASYLVLFHLLGFKETARGCCGTGIYEVTLTCNSFTAPPCEDVSKYLFWDTYHPTERAYNIIIKKILRQYPSSLN